MRRIPTIKNFRPCTKEIVHCGEDGIAYIEVVGKNGNGSDLMIMCREQDYNRRDIKKIIKEEFPAWCGRFLGKLVLPHVMIRDFDMTPTPFLDAIQKVKEKDDWYDYPYFTLFWNRKGYIEVKSYVVF